jgi:hypothetical protein
VDRGSLRWGRELCVGADGRSENGDGGEGKNKAGRAKA